MDLNVKKLAVQSGLRFYSCIFGFDFNLDFRYKVGFIVLVLELGLHLKSCEYDKSNERWEKTNECFATW